MPSRNDELPGARFDVADVGFLLSDPSRAAMLLLLLDGSARPAGELAQHAGVSAQAASAHFARLTAGRLLAVEPRGRQRFYRLRGAEVAAVLEAILAVPPLKRTRLERLRADPRGEAFCAARSCYRHLAGRLGVAIADAWLAEGTLRRRGRELFVTDGGRQRLLRLGLAEAPLDAPNKACLDLTERRPHLGGALGAELLRRLLQLEWLARLGDSRTLRVTARGRRELPARIGIRIAVLDARRY